MLKPRQIVDFLFSLMKTIIISLFISLKVISFQTDKQGQDGILSALPFLGAKKKRQEKVTGKKKQRVMVKRGVARFSGN